MRNTMKRHNHEAGFTLIELLIVMSVMLILITLAVPQLLHIRKQGNETSAEASVKAIAEAELDYNKNYGTFTCTLSALGGDAKAGCNTCHTACNNDAVCAKPLALTKF